MQINDNFCLQFVRTQNTVSRAKIAQSCVLATLHRDFAKFSSQHNFISDLHTLLIRLHILVGLHA